MTRQTTTQTTQQTPENRAISRVYQERTLREYAYLLINPETQDPTTRNTYFEWVATAPAPILMAEALKNLRKYSQTIQ